MGKVINNKTQGTDRRTKTTLVLLLTLATSVFMYQGWFQPVSASAATAVYGVTVPSTASTGIDGAAQMPTGGASIATAPTVRGNMSTTLTTSGASYRPTTGMTSGTPTTLLKLYSPAYAAAQTITAPAGSFAIRGYNASDRWTFHIYSHNPAGTAGNKTLMYSSSTITSGTGSTVTVTPTYTLVNSSMAAANKLLVEVVYTPGGTTYTPRVYLDGTAASTWSRLTVTETATATDSTPPTVGTVTITPDINSTYTSSAPTITTVFTDTQSAVTSCQHTTNGTTWVAGIVTGTTPTYTCTASPTGLSGFLNINMRATSAGGTTTATQIQRTVDATVPTDGTLTVTAGNTQNSISWTAAIDTGGSGIASYILRYATGATAPANCQSGTAVTGSPFSPATRSTTHTGLTNGTQYSYRLCATDNLGNISGGVSKSATPGVVPVSTITSCSGCHGYPPVDGTARNVPVGQFQGSHSSHGNPCTVCHVDNGTNLKHADGNINMAANINNTGGAYSKGAAFAVSNAPFSGGTCSGINCHGQGAPTWGAGSTAPVNGYPFSATQCAKCHSGNLATDVTAANPFYSTAIPKITANADAKVGAHTSHLTTPDGLAAALACADCHGTVALNTVTHMNGSANFIWNTLATKGGTLAPTYSAASRVCTNVYCHGAGMPGGDTTGTNRAPTWNVAFLSVTLSRAACAACHGFPPPTTAGHPAVTIPASWPAVGAATGALGSTCGCHANISATGTTYANIFVNKAEHIDGTLQVSGGHAVPFYAHATPPFTSCTGCHNASAAGTYPATAGAAPNCRGCHVTADPTVTATGCTSCHASPPNGAARPNVTGSHVKHSAIVCATCHNGAGSGSGASHGPGNKGTNPAVDNIVFTAAQAGASATWTAATKTCSTTYCHGATLTGGTAKSPVWGTTLTGCGLCHGDPPATTTHSGVTVTQCITCHDHVNAAGTGFINAALHMNGVIEATGTCIGCHATVQTGTHGTPRAAITSEFGLAWGHKKAGRGAVTDADCIVCHLEGEFATQKPSATKHKDGNIDLRDPDGAGETAITNNSNAAFTFTKYAISYAAGSRTTTLGNTIPEVITMKFCMKCHDSNGATNPTARSNNGGTGTQYMPFGGINMGATYTVLNGAAAAGGLVNVATQFAATNSSRHPVGAPNLRAYPYSTRLVAPYNNIGATRDSNTLTATASPRVKANSVILVCDDCHTTGTSLTTRTITAHGNAVGLRGTYNVATPTLCLGCHGGVTTANTTTSYLDTTNGDHNSGSGMTVGDDHYASQVPTCNNCHFSALTVPARPIKAADIHGFNGLLATGGPWTYGNANGMRPVAFLRNVTRWSALSPRPYTATVAGPGQFNLAGGTPNCGGNGALGSGCGSENHSPYAPGGSY